MDRTKQILKDHILSQFLPGEDPANLKVDTPLITGGILDSVTTLLLVTFIEKTFDVEFKPHEAGVDHLNTIDLMAKLIQAKKNA